MNIFFWLGIMVAIFFGTIAVVLTVFVCVAKAYLWWTDRKEKRDER